MAILSVTMVDSYGRTTNRRYEMESQASLVDYAAVADAFIASLEDVTDLGVLSADLILKSISAGFDVTAGANVDVGATFSGYIYGGAGAKASTKVPGIKSTLVDADGSVPITGVVATHLAHFEEAGDFELSDGQAIDDWIRGSLDK